MKNREEKLLKSFEKLKKVKFNPYTQKKTGHIFSDFMKFVRKYSHLHDCEENNHRLGWTSMKSNIICTTCGIINIDIPYNLKSEWKEKLKEKEDKLQTENNNWLILQLKEIQETEKTLWNKFKPIFINNNLEDIKKLKKEPLWVIFESIMKKIEELENLRNCMNEKHNLQWNDQNSSVTCKHCNIVLVEVPMNKSHTWKTEFVIKKQDLINNIYQSIHYCLKTIMKRKQKPTKEMWESLIIFYKEKSLDETDLIKSKLGISKEMEELWDNSKLISINDKLQQNRKKQMMLTQQRYDLEILLQMSRIIKVGYDFNVEAIENESNKIDGKISKLGKEYFKISIQTIEGDSPYLWR